MSTKKPKHKIDGKWFRHQFDVRGFSMREFARRVKLDISALSRTLSGDRKFVVEDADLWAGVLQVPVEEILAKVGVRKLALDGAKVEVKAVAEDPMPPMGGVVDAATGIVTFVPTQASATADVVALSIEGDPFLVDWVAWCRPTEPQATGDGLEIGIVRLGDGKMAMRKIRPSFVRGHFDLGPVFGFGQREDDVVLSGVIPVIAIRRRKG